MVAAQTNPETVFRFIDGAWHEASADALILPVYGQKNGFTLEGPLKNLDQSMQGAITTAIKEDKFEGKKEQLLVLRKSVGDLVQARRVVLVGLGEIEKVSPDKVDKAIQKAMGSISKLQDLKTVVIALPEKVVPRCSTVDAIQSAIDGVCQATYSSQEATEPTVAPETVMLWLPQKETAEMNEALHVGEVMARARSFAKDLVNKPANLKTTETMVNAAKEIAKLPHITLEIESGVHWIEEQMPAFFSVAKGSLASDPPKFISLKYSPPGGKPKLKLALVGKTVIFDTGGYQVKTDNYMNTMKGDMTGGAMVLGAIRALAELKPEHVEISVYLAATPNKIDSDAMLPDSIIASTCGKKIEIRHTDAEGRLTLIDAVAKAGEHKPDVILTIATLTGAAMRAVGTTIALMGNNMEWRDKVELAARSLGEPVQPLDVTEDDYDDIKSKLDGADIINTSKNKCRGAQSAAAFVMTGAPEGIPLVHLDIAGADMTGDEKATGIAQKTLIRFVMNENK